MESMGQIFKNTRERKRISLSQAAAQTRIKMAYIEMMERDDFSRMPAPAYAKGFIRLYAGFLGLDPGPLVQEYVQEHLGQRGAAAAAATVHGLGAEAESTPADEATAPVPVSEPASRPPVVPVAPRSALPLPPPRVEPVPAPDPVTTPEPVRAPPVSVAPMQEDEPARSVSETVQVPPAPKPPQPIGPRLDFSAVGRVLRALPWRGVAAALFAVAIGYGLIVGISRCVRGDETTAGSGNSLFKRGVPAVVAEPPEPYLDIPGATGAGDSSP